MTNFSFKQLRTASHDVRERLGCTHTLHEVLRQPATWRATANRLRDERPAVLSVNPRERLPRQVVLTGSGSSEYVGECVAPVLQAMHGIPVQAIAAGTLLANREGALPPGSGLLVSVARSGDSPESAAVVDAMLGDAPAWNHLAITCNAAGALATRYRNEPRMRIVLLDAETNDESLVMTSSFTNLLLATNCLLVQPESADAAADIVELLFDRYGDVLASWGARSRNAAVFLGGGANFGAAREAALKMLETSAGAVRVLTESSLGLRHGPMAWLNRDSLLVSFLSGRPAMRDYEIDLLDELTAKNLGAARIVVGEHVDPCRVGDKGLAIDLPGLYELSPVQQAMVHAVVGQLLALFQCLALGEMPDAPSRGVLTRVVKRFAMHPTGTAK